MEERSVDAEIRRIKRALPKHKSCKCTTSTTTREVLVSEDLQRWIRCFERYTVASSLDKASEENQVNTLIYTVGTVADDILGSLGITEMEQKYDIVKQKFEDFFILGHNKEEGNIGAGQV